MYTRKTTKRKYANAYITSRNSLTRFWSGRRHHEVKNKLLVPLLCGCLISPHAHETHKTLPPDHALVQYTRQYFTKTRKRAQAETEALNALSGRFYPATPSLFAPLQQVFFVEAVALILLMRLVRKPGISK